MYKIKTYNKISKTGLEVFDDKYTIGDEVENADGAIVRSASLHETEFPESLKAIARAGAGTNNIPIDRCSEQGIVVFNTPGANANAVKELVIAGMLISSRRVISGIEWAKTLKGNGAEVSKMVEKGKTYIREGDIFQVVLANRLSAEAEGSLLDTYRVLRTLNPSPYMFFFSGDDIELAGSSPETLTRLENGDLFTFPLAGSRPRGKTPEEDRALEDELLHNTKELAEHNMLVDLGRNDLGRISEFGSVHVERYLDVLRFSHIMHIGSTVHSTIRKDKTAIDAIASVLPAGTLSGAPKIRACEIIDELEGHKRGVYGGAIGYIDFTGNMDCCIGIRLAYKKGNHVYACSGAGIVADSIPEQEHQECLNKAKAVVIALQQANGGIDK